MDCLQFSRQVLQRVLGFSPTQLDYIFALPGRKALEVIFSTYANFEQCIERFHQKASDTPGLKKITLIPLSERDARSVTVIMYSEKISTEDIQTWLSFQCTVARGMELRDQDGIRTGARRYYVRLRRDGETGRLHHLPSTIQLGSIRGHVFYQGQPKDCRKCGSLDHLAADCNAIFCKNCNSNSHATRNCDHAKLFLTNCTAALGIYSCYKSATSRIRTITAFMKKDGHMVSLFGQGLIKIDLLVWQFS
uniref:CCHC-type domain-containing protein n=1 Tax=Acanthochromis polyacanthus TaxID=80966 RepID=A0A3Q1F6A4_9TELE